MFLDSDADASGADIADLAMTSVVHSFGIDATSDSSSTPVPVTLFREWYRIQSFKVVCYTYEHVDTFGKGSIN